MRYVPRFVPFGVLVATALAVARPTDAREFKCAAGDAQCLAMAIVDANAQPGRNRILLNPGTYTLTASDHDASGPTGLPSITGRLRIESSGPGMARLVRDASAPSFRLLHVASSGELELEGIAIENGQAVGDGGALLNEGGSVRIIRGELLRNRAIGGANPFVGGSGGAVSNQCGELMIVATTISESFAGRSGGGLHTCGRAFLVDSIVSSGVAFRAGGIELTDGSLRLVRTIVFENSAAAGGGGGLDLTGGSALIEHSTLDGNHAGPAGAVSVGHGTQLTVRDSAFLRNRSGVDGAGIFHNSGHVEIVNSTFASNSLITNASGAPIVIVNRGTLSITGSTLADNLAFQNRSPAPPGRRHWQVFTDSGAVTTIQNTILSNDDPFIVDCEGPLTSLGHNLISDPAGCTIELQGSDLTGTAGLDALTDDGTAGNGHLPLLPTSPAIGAANDDACSKKDQLGVPRKKSCDIGAVEFNPHEQ